MTKLQITYKAPQELLAYFNNSRTHSDAQIDQIVASIEQFGWTNPILVDGKNGVIAGHGRLLAAIKMEMEQVPTIDLAHLTDIQKRAYIIADNKIALNASWDELTLASELNDMQEFDLSLLGFTDDELERYLKENANDEDNGKEHDFGQSYEIIVECASEYEQRQILEEFTARGLKCKSLLR